MDTFFLLPDDETPTSNRNQNNALHKTKHSVKFVNKGVLFALAFTCGTKESVFDNQTNRWIWTNCDEDTMKKVQGHLKKKENEYKWVDACACLNVISQIAHNVCEFIHTVLNACD